MLSPANFLQPSGLVVIAYAIRIYHLNAARAPIGCYLIRVVGDKT